MTLRDHIVMLIIAALVILGGYQLYFWCQKVCMRPARRLHTRADNWFPYHPAWVWIYSGLYYPLAAVVIFTIKDIRTFLAMMAGYLMLLLLQIAFFLWFPVATPPEWREQVKGNGISERFLRAVHKYDADSNCFPSMHVSLATFVTLCTMANVPAWGFWPLAFPLFVAFSTLYTKRHYVLDLLPGAALGWLVFLFFRIMV